MSTIANNLRLNEGQNKVIEKLLEDVVACEKEGTLYTGKRKYSKWADDKLLISSTSHEYQIIGNAMEDGHSLRATTDLVNEHR